MIVCAVISVLGAAVTYYFIPNDVVCAEERFRENSREETLSAGHLYSSSLLHHESGGSQGRHSGHHNNDYIYE